MVPNYCMNKRILHKKLSNHSKEIHPINLLWLFCLDKAGISMSHMGIRKQTVFCSSQSIDPSLVLFLNRKSFKTIIHHRCIKSLQNYSIDRLNTTFAHKKITLAGRCYDIVYRVWVQVPFSGGYFRRYLDKTVLGMRISRITTRISITTPALGSLC